MPAAGVVMIVAAVLIVVALVIFLLSTIVALQKITKGLDRAIAGVVEIIKKTDPVAPVVKDINANLDAGVDLLFREKALWTFSRGQRLGDLRRLVRQYARPADEAFPVGKHYRGGDYGKDVNLPVPKDEEKNNPNFTGCIDRAA